MRFSLFKADVSHDSFWSIGARNEYGYQLFPAAFHDALPHRADSESLWPSLNEGQVGIHNFPFEACSIFTRVTACRLAPHLMWALSRGSYPVGQPCETARQRSSHTDNSTTPGVGLSPTVICAFEVTFA
jgi:hypothetical protein